MNVTAFYHAGCIFCMKVFNDIRIDFEIEITRLSSRQMLISTAFLLDLTAFKALFICPCPKITAMLPELIIVGMGSVVQKFYLLLVFSACSVKSTQLRD